MIDSLERGVKRGEWLEFRLSAKLQTEREWYSLLLAYTRIPENMLTKLFLSQGLRLNGNYGGIRLFPEEKAQFDAEWHDLNILYEDDFCLVVDKPAGMAVHPAFPGQNGTLAGAVAWYYESTGQSCRIRHIHRLDENTSGPVLYAKNGFAQQRLDEAMRDKAIERNYIAVVSGRLGRRSGTIDAPIGKDRHHKQRRRVSAGGDRALTHFQLNRQFRNAALLRLRLETGRTHQIRVHLSYIGHPIIGDELYGGRTDLLDRQALHGETLSFVHPWTGERVEVRSPWPVDMEELVERMETENSR